MRERSNSCFLLCFGLASLVQPCVTFHSSSLSSSTTATRTATKTMQVQTCQYLSSQISPNAFASASNNTFSSRSELGEDGGGGTAVVELDQFHILPPEKPSFSGKRRKKMMNSNNNYYYNNNNNNSNRNSPAIPDYIPSLSDVIVIENEKKRKRQELQRLLTSKILNQDDKNDHDNKDEDNTTNEPWRANYASSTATQKRIQKAASTPTSDEKTNRKGKLSFSSALDRAINVMNVLLNTPSEWCNESNVVCALTASAKVLKAASSSSSNSISSTHHQQKQIEFRKLLHETLCILNELVRSNRLNTRQLANAAWAVVKHYSIDPLVLPPPSVSTSDATGKTMYNYQNKNGDIGLLSTSEKWDMDEEQRKEEKYEHELRALETLDEIALQLIEIISPSQDLAVDRSTKMQQPVKFAEISMICWAYSIINPRQFPAGWRLPPRVGRMEMGHLSFGNDGDSGPGRQGNTVIYECRMETSPNGELLPSSSSSPTCISIVDKLFEVIAEKLVEHVTEDESGSSLTMIEQCGWKELSNIAWAYANRGYCGTQASTDMILQLTREATERLDATVPENHHKMLCRDVSEIAWALGNLQSDNFMLSQALEDFVHTLLVDLVEPVEDRPLKKWKSADLVQLAVAMAHGRLDEHQMIIHVYDEALRSLKQELELNGDRPPQDHKRFQSWELAVLLWVQARLYLTKDLGVVFDEYAEILPRVLLSRMGILHKLPVDNESLQKAFERVNLRAQEKANIAWSLTVLEKYSTAESIRLLQGIFDVASTSCSEGRPVNLEHAHQLWQSIFLLEDECPELDVQEEFLTFLRETWDQEKSRLKASSSRHKALSDTLTFMGVSHYNEHDEDIDVAIVLKNDSKWLHKATRSDCQKCQTRVAVEFDGPAHFTKQPEAEKIPGQKPEPPRALGHTVLKYKLLKKQGWTVVRIPFYEFDRIPFWASMERQRYVQRKLKTHANIKFSEVDVSEYKPPVPNKQSRFD